MAEMSCVCLFVRDGHDETMNHASTVFIVPVCLAITTTINATAIGIIFTPAASGQAETIPKDN
jgi:hypothetical protein